MRAVISQIALLIFISLPVPAYGQVPSAPKIIDSGASGCVPRDEICGDFIDQDCDGYDAPCPGNDKDRDGFPAGQDCDDQNPRIYPGITTACEASCGQGHRTCRADGSMTACSCAPLCEAKGSGRCYYVSPLTGSDASDGSFLSPWKSLVNITQDSPSPIARKLTAGDVVYLMSGTYDQSFVYSHRREVVQLRGISGTANAPIVLKAYPGANPVIRPSQRSGGISVLSAKHLLIEGLEIQNTWETGIDIWESENIELRNLHIHNVDGEDNHNIGGLRVTTVENLRLHHSLIHDNYDRTNADTGGMPTQNSRNIVLFGGGNIRIDHNTIFQSPSIEANKTGACLAYKHSATVSGARFEVDHNVFWNCRFQAIGIGTYGARVHHNLIVNSDPIVIADFGGPTHHRDNIIEKNTIIGSTALLFNPSEDYSPVGDLTFRNNIIIDNGSYHQERGMLTIGTYGSDELYRSTINPSKQKFSSNCYYNSAGRPLRFAIFAANGGRYGTQGGMWTLQQWQAKGFDNSSSITNPALNSDLIPSGSACRNNGWFAP